MPSSSTFGTMTTSRRAAILAISFLALLSAPGAEAQPSEKKIGFSVQVLTDGFVNVTVAKIVVTQVSPDSQALAAGVVVGDELVKIQETTVPGNSALKLKEHMAFVPGSPKKMTFKRPTGAQYDVVFVRPAEPKQGG
jgi:C-terminal processing protease CtpA/Prc